jgi:hypothetical protein
MVIEMDKNAAYALNDLLDIVEELTNAVRELNPGHNFKLVEFLTARASRSVEEILRSVDAEQGAKND